MCTSVVNGSKLMKEWCLNRDKDRADYKDTSTTKTYLYILGGFLVMLYLTGSADLIFLSMSHHHGDID